MANNPSQKPKGVKKAPVGLSELLEKQKLLELQLKRGVLDDAIQELTEVVPPVPDLTDVID